MSTKATPKDTAIELARRLAVAAAGDTACRDLYLYRAREILAGVFPESTYREAIDAQARIETVLRQARDAITQQDWATAKLASDRAAGLKNLVASEASTIAAVGSIYSEPPVICDPFSPSLPRSERKGEPPAVLRESIGRALASLEKDDASWANLYAARKKAVASFPLPLEEATAKETATAGAADLQRQAMAAAERGSVDQLQTLLAALVKQKEAGEQTAPADAKAPAASALRAQIPPVLSEPFPAGSVALAQKNGFEQVEIKPASPEAAAAIVEFLTRHAGSASVSIVETAAAREGITDLRAVFEHIEVGEKISDVLAETISLFAWQIYIGSGGLRYFPIGAPREFVLVESFAEGEEQRSPVLDALELPRRRELARNEIEDALVRHGSRILEEQLELDPFAFRLVCIPADVYARIGMLRGWGKRPEWTHFDGYRVLSGNRMLALVGGNAEFGGLADLCGIGINDQRRNVFARFAVVRRERLATRLI